MSIAAWIPAAAGILIAVAAVMSLWRDAERHPGSVRHGHRWFAVTAVCWAAGLVIRQAVPPGPAGALTFADLPSLIALVAVVAGLRALAPDAPAAARDQLPARQAGPGGGGLAIRLADGYLLAAGLFLIGWVTIFAADYAHWDEGPGVFAAEMIHPLADAAVLGWVLPLVVAAGRRAAAACLALLAVTTADALDVAARVTGGRPGLAAQLLVLAAVALLALTPWAARLPRPAAAQRLPRVLPAIRAAGERESGNSALAGPDRSAAAMVAAGTAVAAGLVVMAWGLAGSPGPGPVVALVGGSAVLALAVRALGLAWQQRAGSRAWRDSGRQFRELADRTSDVVLLCDLAGAIRYASPAVADYGYFPDSLAGVSLAGLLHPEDRAGGARAARVAIRSAGTAGRYPCRVRAADGTWRHVQATVSRYRYPGAPDRLLVTARDLSDQVALRRQVAHLTFHDGLTGLPNRAYIEDRARAALAAAGPAAAAPAAGAGVVAGIILLDLDGFTAVNDSAGHSAGDLILAQAARRLRAVVPPADTVARWGGDEFAVLIEMAAASREIIDIAERLAASISAHAFRVGDRELSLTASVGVALADGSPPGYVWRNADVAMSRAKDAGGARVEVFAPGGETSAAPRLALAGELQQAIAGGGLSLSYQPVVELATGRVASAVAGVRMRRGGADVPAADLLTAAESSGLIVPLGDWVLREACAQAGQWHQAGLTAGVWVKVSPAQAVAPRFAESVLAALAASGLPPAALTLEATERDLIHGGGTLLPGLAEVRAHGVRLAIGDFGTDYASLSYLRRRPVDVVKIDSEFVAGLGADTELAKLVEAIVRVGRDLGIEVVAAGIGRPRQLALLRGMGCQFGQGELVAPAVDAHGLGAAGPPAAGPPAAGPPAAGGRPADETSIPHGETKLLSS
jgi:diguanylate cyclase (GGDEF)-like protein/PAS domain S-box-containing protein